MLSTTSHGYTNIDEQRLTIPGFKGQRTSISYIDPPDLHYPVYLSEQISIPPASQQLLDVKLQLAQADDLIFQPVKHFQSKFLFIPKTLLNVANHSTKVLLINAHNTRRTLSKNTKIGTISIDPKISVCLTMDSPLSNHTEFENSFSRSLRSRTVGFQANDLYNSFKVEWETCQQQFLTGNDLQKHLREVCYPQEIRQHIYKLSQHIEDSQRRFQVQDILWRNKDLFQSTPSVVNLPPQSAIKTSDHPPIFCKQYPTSEKDQQIKEEEVKKLLIQKRIEESNSPWSSPVILVKKRTNHLDFALIMVNLTTLQ
ncbi:unnamed protein product [Didymodactylos carnosus]|uniref:Uncharacterized protein n=1 Tax=Didymodactylos carnosus TaxID=1234261 RepID=A0A8S2Q7Z3_9BILA|nr:unnamed protein product [Didymodactylos carnosus]CAF4093446.1 unnamed protein product [Didymodactylos carnosus]